MRVAGFLVPEQIVLRQRLGIGDGRVEIEAAVGIDRQLWPAAAPHDGVDAAQVFSSEAPPIFILTTV